VEGVALESYWDLWKETEEYTRKIGGEPHYQLPPHAQSKLVRAITGRVLDVAVDIRKDSPTFGLHVTAELSEENKHQLFIPAGFAHDGFLVLSQEAVFSYKVDAPYAPDHERGIYYADPVLEIDWSLPPSDMRLSEKDRKLPLMVTGDG
jgi:dTDP-4-dehydrorhamnose 3,5-epimerase